MIQQCGTQADGQQCDDVALKQGWNKYKQMKMVEEWTKTDIQTHTSRPGNLAQLLVCTSWIQKKAKLRVLIQEWGVNWPITAG